MAEYTIISIRPGIRFNYERINGAWEKKNGWSTSISGREGKWIYATASAKLHRSVGATAQTTCGAANTLLTPSVWFYFASTRLLPLQQSHIRNLGKTVWNPKVHTIRKHPINFYLIKIRQMDETWIKREAKNEIRKGVMVNVTNDVSRKQEEYLANIPTNQRIVALKFNDASLSSEERRTGSSVKSSRPVKRQDAPEPGRSSKTTFE